jgi:hypothetical protein
MQGIILLGISSMIMIIGSVIFFFIAIAKKKMPLFYFALLLSFAGVGTGLFAGYKFLYKSYVKISDSLKPRTGEEIYAALFDGNPNECTKVIEKQDQVVPVIDVAIYLHFKTCESELNRILKQQQYVKSVLVKNEEDTTSNSINPDWFEPLKMDDSVYVYTYKKDDFGNYQSLFVSKKKDEVYCKDVWN